MQNRRQNQKGVTLVEVLISLVILLIVFMGLIQASILSINHNLRNELRDEAARIASENMAIAMATQINNLAGVPPPATIPTAVVCPVVMTAGPTPLTRVFRNINQTFNWQRDSCYTDTTYSNAQVTITVRYIYPEQPPADLADDTKNQRTIVNSIVRRF